MIKAFALKGADIESVDPSDLQAADWLDVTSPDKEEISKVSEIFSINPEDFLDCLDPEERPRFELEEGYYLLMLRILATEREEAPIAANTVPVGFFVLPTKLISVHSDAVDIVSFFRQRRRKRVVTSSMDLTVTLLGNVVRRHDRFVREIQIKLTEFKNTVVKSMKAEAVEEAYQLNNDLVFLNTSIFGNSNAMEHMLRQKQTVLGEDHRERLEDTQIDSRQNYETTSLYRELLSNILDTHSSAISNNLNLVMKILASLSLILMLPTLIASLYGMNVPLPLAGEGYAFVIIVLISAIWSGFLWFLFRKLDWL